MAGSTKRPVLTLGRQLGILLGRGGERASQVGEAAGREIMENLFPSLTWKHMDVSFFLSFSSIRQFEMDFLSLVMEGILIQHRS